MFNNFLPKDYKFHLIGDDNFEKFAVTVLGHIYNIKTLLTFSKGPDGGRDAAAHNVNIDFGGGNLENQDLIVQVKHTGKVESITDSVRKRIFKGEKEKVEKLVKENQLDTTYIMFTNYDLPALQEQKLNKCFNAAKNVPAEKGVELNDSQQIVNCFEGAGAKHVVIIGKETLSQWLGDSPELQMKVIRYYPHGDITDLMHCSNAVKSIQQLKIYREDLEKTIDVEAYVEALTKANKIVKSYKGLVFITGVPGSGKTTVAKQLVIQLFDEYDTFTYYDITIPKHFDTNFFPDAKYIFFMDNMDSNSMNEWSKLEDKLKIAIEGGSKFVFAGNTTVLEEAHSSLNKFYDRLSNAAINLSEQQFSLSKDKKQDILKKHVDMGDIDNSTKVVFLKDDMLSHAAEIDCPCFPLVAKSLGSRDRLDKFSAVVPTCTVYNQEFLNQFFNWVQSTTVNSDSNSGSCASPRPKRRRLQDNITGS